MTSSPLSCFGLPPYGDGIEFHKIQVTTGTFSPPYGDGMKSLESLKDLKPFSPPYGDGITSSFINVGQMWFSPPYGDGILNISQNTAKLKSRMARKYSLYYNDVFLR